MAIKNNKNGEITFIWDQDPLPQDVYLAGTFNDWDPHAHRLRKFKGTYRARLQLDTGQHQYKFVVDGHWLDDPDAPERTINEHGTYNSVLCVD